MRTFNNYGTIDNLGDLNNDDIFNNHVGGTLDNDGTINNNSNATLNNDATVNNRGTINSDQDATVNNDDIINNYGSINSDQGASVNNDATINNHGTLRIGNSETGSILNNDGVINNHGNIINKRGDCTSPNGNTVNNNDGGTINNKVGGTFDGGGTLYNDGTINNNGTFINRSNQCSNRLLGGFLFNDGTFNNNLLGTFNNHTSTIVNRNTFNNYGTVHSDNVFDLITVFDNNAGSTLTNYGTFINGDASTVNNNGTLHNFGGAIIVNEDTFNSGGLLVNIDGVMDNEGTFVHSGLMDNAGYIFNDFVINNSGEILNGGAIYNCGGTFTGDPVLGNPVGGVCDDTPPNITSRVSGAAGNNDWYVGDVPVNWSVTDAESAIVAANRCEEMVIDFDTAGLTLTCTAANVGGTASESVTIKRDATAPTASASVSPDPNANGWNNTDVTVSFSGTDNVSGLDSCDAPVVLSGEGTNQSAGGTCTDLAGNVSALATAGNVNIDKTAPVVMVTGVVDGETYIVGTVPVASCDTQDALSGVATSASLALTGGDANGAGTITATCAGATDNAGNNGTASVSYTVITPSEAIENLIDQVESLNLQQGVDNSLDAKLDAALQALDDLNQNDDVAAVNALQAFINAVEAQRGKKVPDADADALIASVQAIIDAINAG